MGCKRRPVARKMVSWSSPDPEGVLAWHLDQEASELFEMFRGQSVVNVEVRFFVNQFVTGDGVAEVHTMTMSFDGRDERDFWGDFWAEMRDARSDLVGRLGLRLDGDEADKYVVPSVVRMWAPGGRQRGTLK